MNQPIHTQQQQGVNIGMMQINQMINQNQTQGQKDLRHLLISPNQNQQASMLIGQPNINQIQQHPPPPQTSQNWMNTRQQQQPGYTQQAGGGNSASASGYQSQNRPYNNNQIYNSIFFVKYYFNSIF